MIKMMSASAKHISPATADWLTRQGLINAVAPYSQKLADIHVGTHGFGWFVYCHDDGTDDYPADLVELMNYAANCGADYLNIDEAGVVYPKLKLYKVTDG